MTLFYLPLLGGFSDEKKKGEMKVSRAREELQGK
jgi:hypothetical protein